MPDWLNHILEWFKASPRYFFPVAVASAAVLFLPDRFLDPLGLLPFRIESKAYVGAAFLLSSCVLVCDALIKLYTWGQKEIQHRRAISRGHRRLEQLTPGEQRILRTYLAEETRTQTFPLENGVIAGLVHATIIYPAVSQADQFEYPFNIQPWAWDYLNAHPELVGQDPSAARQSTRRC